CLLQLASARPLLITAKHTSRHRDINAIFLFLQGVSTSESWFMLPDNGTLWSAGSGLVDAEGYKQYTNEWICLDYFTVY
uniref:C-type lectin domain-containing protein n=1 Tax=Pygocentrus nattereri TaxID=42514 RepID=A0A3B4CIP0_PYGNA